MDYVTPETMQKLCDAGFSYPDYEHFLNKGMLYHYDGRQYLIGGFLEERFLDLDKEIAAHGQWLPSAAQLLTWLADTDFSVQVSMEGEVYVSVLATDLTDGTRYSGGDYSLANALAKVITKICKSNRRALLPKPKIRLEILDE